jgi:hypothetical protein
MISEELQRLCERLRPEMGDVAEPGPYIGIEQLTSKFGTFYEKVRSLVDYKEAHVIRRGVIRRILKRQLYLERLTSGVGTMLLKELVESGYLPNNRVPEAKGATLQAIVSKWMLLRREGLTVSQTLDFSAIEVERFLYPDQHADLVVDAFFASAAPALVYQGMKGKDMTSLTYAACRRSLLNEDRAALVYALAIRMVPELASMGGTDQYYEALSANVQRAIRLADSIATDSLVWKVSARLRNHSLYYAVFLEILRQYGKGTPLVFGDEAKLREVARSIIEKKQKAQRRGIRVSGRRAVLYLLLTKILLGVLLEWPYEYFFLKHTNYLALGTNVLFHPLLLLSMVTFLGSEKKGAERVVNGVQTIVEGKKMPQIFIKPPVSPTIFFFVFCFYVALFAVSFGAILAGLLALDFNVVSILLFFAFLTLVSYFGLRIRTIARQWEPAPEKVGTIAMVWSLFTNPIIRTGRWFSIRFSSVNVFVFLLDFLVEVPFKAFLGIFDASLSFIKEQKTDTY